MKVKLYRIFIAACFLTGCVGYNHPKIVEESPSPAGLPFDPLPSTRPSATPPPLSLAPTFTPDLIKPIVGGDVSIGVLEEPSSLNPLLSTASIDTIIRSFVFEGLIGIDDKGIYQPFLASELPTVSDDGKVITYTLRQDVTFSNGDPFSCADVQYTLDAILSDLSLASKSGYVAISSIDCPNKYTAVIRFNQLYAPYQRLFPFILPRTAGDLSKVNTWEYNRKPIGTGPWIIKEWKDGDQIILEKNPRFRESGKPFLDFVTIKILPNREIGLEMLASGQLTVLWDLAEEDTTKIETIPDTSLAFTLHGSGENELLVLNLANPSVQAPFDPTLFPHPILSDIRVRQAIQLGIDKSQIAKSVLSGRERPGTSILPSGPYYCVQPPSEYDPEKAKALLKEAGWALGEDKIRIRDGRRLSLTLSSTAGSPIREETELLLVEMLKDIGIELVVENVPPETLFAGWEARGMRKIGNFDIMMYTSGPDIDPDLYLIANFHTAFIPSAENNGDGSNFSRYMSPDVNQWINDSLATTDMKKRHELFCKIAAQINQDIPRIFLYERFHWAGYSSALQNFRISPGPAEFTFGSQDWWLKQK